MVWQKYCHSHNFVTTKFSVYTKWGIQPPPYSLLVWRMTSINEFDGLAVIWLQILGIRSPIFGWSGWVARKRSSCSLNSTLDDFLISLRDFGRQLKSLGPATWKLFSLKVWTACLPLDFGISQCLPLLSLVLNLIPQLGTIPSRYIWSCTFQLFSAESTFSDALDGSSNPYVKLLEFSLNRIWTNFPIFLHL